MSSYVRYCRDQAAECARRAKLASSPQIAAERRSLGLRWLRLAEKAQAAPFARTSKPGTATAAARPEAPNLSLQSTFSPEAFETHGRGLARGAAARGAPAGAGTPAGGE